MVKKWNKRMGRDNLQPVIRTLTSLKMRWDTIHPLISTFCGHNQWNLQRQTKRLYTPPPEKVIITDIYI